MRPPLAVPPSTVVSQPWAWLVIAAISVGIDYLSGPTIEFPLFYLVPISLASWHGTRRWGLTLAIGLPLVRLGLRSVWDTPWTLLESLVNAGIRITVFVCFALLIHRTARQMRELTHLHLLEEMTGVCHTCKKIRDRGAEGWQPLDAYLERHPEQFSSDLCPECAKSADEIFDRR